MTADPLWPLLDRFPGLGSLPRVALRTAATPVEPLQAISPRLWIKRDDLSADPIGGNKVRSLEFLLGGAHRGDRIVTAGSWGSTHALTTAVHGRALGLDVVLGAWPQEMNEVAHAVSRRLDEETERRKFGNVAFVAAWLAWRSWRGDRVIPAGGTSPLGMLGHVNAAFELAEQIRAGRLPPPKRVVVPLGTGGTTAGLALGFALAGVETTIVGARVVPRIVGRISRVRRLARATATLIARLTGERVPPGMVDVRIADGVYGGAYGRPLAAAGSPSRLLARLGLKMDPTYSAKALVAAIESAQTGDTLFWMTFDSRWITSRKPVAA
jgi:1-aminocyclopropane-1-carboxylate deaminase/D-cysteine desulfhydrase-like pyridoxal-dependent ACC family enzyme